MSIVPSHNKATRPQEKQARLAGRGPSKKKGEKKLYSKLAKVPPGAKLHLWMFTRWTSEHPKVARYKCAVCDYVDTAPWPYTPEPHEPYCPAPRTDQCKHCPHGMDEHGPASEFPNSLVCRVSTCPCIGGEPLEAST